MTTTSTTSVITPRERAEVEAANASGRQPVVFVHGLWLLASSWDAWRERFEAEGYATVGQGAEGGEQGDHGDVRLAGRGQPDRRQRHRRGVGPVVHAPHDAASAQTHRCAREPTPAEAWTRRCPQTS